YRFAKSADGKLLRELINDETWYRNQYRPKLGKGGHAMLQGRCLCASRGTSALAPCVRHGMPVIHTNGEYTLVRDVPIDDFSRERMNATLKELEEERAAATPLLRCG